jgi:YQGE family putative transporter
MSPRDIWNRSTRYAKSADFDYLTDTGETPVYKPQEYADPPGRLGKASRDLLGAGSLVNVGLALSSIFVSLFFYVSSGSITDMALFAFGSYGGLMAMSVVVAAAFPDTSPRRLFRVGVGLTALFYLSLILLGKGATPLAFPLGLFSGSASGVYWFGVNTLIYDVVDTGERGQYYGANFALLHVANVVGPFGAGVLIATIGGVAGYFAVFAASTVAFATAFVVSRRLADTAGVGGVPIREALRLPFVSPEWGRMWTVVALRGFKQSAGSLGLIILVALTTKSSTVQGEFAAATALAAVGTSILAGKVSPDHRGRVMWAGAGAFVLSTGLLLHSGLTAILTYGVVTGLVYPAVMVPVSSVVLEAMDIDPNAAERRGGYVLSREIAVNVGRLLAIGLLLTLLHFEAARAAVLVTIGSAAVLQLAVAGLSARTSVRARAYS